MPPRQVTPERAGMMRGKEYERLVDVARRIQDPELTVEPIIRVAQGGSDIHDGRRGIFQGTGAVATAGSDVSHGVSAVRALGLDRPHNLPWQVWSEMNASTPSAKSPPV